jgi:hypothetical protein
MSNQDKAYVHVSRDPGATNDNSLLPAPSSSSSSNPTGKGSANNGNDSKISRYLMSLQPHFNGMSPIHLTPTAGEPNQDVLQKYTPDDPLLKPTKITSAKLKSTGTELSVNDQGN